jgi:hypothetical protein
MSKDFAEFLDALNSHGVSYVVIIGDRARFPKRV